MPDSSFYKYARSIEDAIGKNSEKFSTEDLLTKLCKKFKFTPPQPKTAIKKNEELDETTKALRFWFQQVKQNGRPQNESRKAMNYVITALMTSRPNVSALGRELGVATDGQGAKRWQDAKKRVDTNLATENKGSWTYHEPAKQRKDAKKSSSSSSSRGSRRGGKKLV